MGAGAIVLVTDHSSGEGSRAQLEAAVELLTGAPPVSLDARHLMDGGGGRASVAGGGPGVEIVVDAVVERPDVVIVYEIPPARRRSLEAFQRQLGRSTVVTLGADATGWRTATEKDRTARRFARDGIPQMETVALSRPDVDEAAQAFEQLGGDVWTKPTVGLGGADVFHVATEGQLVAAVEHYEKRRASWLMSRDAGNVDAHGRRHQFRVVVMGDRVLRACEHVQADPDAPCNEAQGAVSTVVPLHALPPNVADVAVAATRSVGLPFGGVDLAVADEIVVFEVNVHPVFGSPGGFESVAVPYVEAHLGALG